VHVKRQDLLRTIEAARPAEGVPPPSAAVSLGDDRMIAAVRLTFFLCLLALGVGLLLDYRDFIVAHSPLLYGTVAIALGCLAGVAFHRTTTLCDGWLARRDAALDLVMGSTGGPGG